MESKTKDVRLGGAPGNVDAAGARLEIETNGGRKLVREIRAGGGYLAQSTSRQFVALAPDEFVAAVTVRWPDGAESKTSFEDFRGRLEISEPEP